VVHIPAAFHLALIATQLALAVELPCIHPGTGQWGLCDEALALVLVRHLGKLGILPWVEIWTVDDLCVYSWSREAREQKRLYDITT